MSEENTPPPIDGPPTSTEGEAPPIEPKTEEPKASEPVEKKAEEFVTEKKAFVRYKGKMGGLSHNGSLGASYFFSKKQWTPINQVDEKNYERKAKNNPQNWDIKYEDALIYKEIHCTLVICISFSMSMYTSHFIASYNKILGCFFLII